MYGSSRAYAPCRLPVAAPPAASTGRTVFLTRRLTRLRKFSTLDISLLEMTCLLPEAHPPTVTVGYRCPKFLRVIRQEGT